MSKIVSFIVVLVGICQFQYSCAFKWVSLNPGDPMPPNAFHLDQDLNKYIGRTPYYNSILLAEVYNSSYGIILSYSKEVVKHEFEVLVLDDNDNCEWVSYGQDISEDIVRGGTAWNREPIFVGKRQTRSHGSGIASIFLTSNQIQINPRDVQGDSYALTCKEHHVWVDSTSDKLPANSVHVDAFKKRFVARLLGPLTMVPAQVTPESNTTTALFDNVQLSSFRNQVLIEDINKYSWKTLGKGYIPDYAVVCGKLKNDELMYITKSSSLNYIVFSQALLEKFSYDILVRNT